MLHAASIARVVGSTPVRAAVNGGFHAYARRRVRQLARLDPARTQERVLLDLVRTAAATRFGRDHGFGSIRSVADFQARVPLRTYETLWRDYLKAAYPRFDSVTWPGLVPYLALTSGTTQGATKYIPVSQSDGCVEPQGRARRWWRTTWRSRPDSKLFRGKIFFLGGSTNLESTKLRACARGT